MALVSRGVARWWLGRHGWREDLHDAVAMARNSDPATSRGRDLKLLVAVFYGVLRADDSVVSVRAGGAHRRAIKRRPRPGVAEVHVGYCAGNRDAAADSHRGLELLVQVRVMWLRERVYS